MATKVLLVIQWISLKSIYLLTQIIEVKDWKKKKYNYLDYMIKYKLICKEYHPHNHTYYMIWGENGELERIALAGLHEVQLYLTGEDRTVGSIP